MAALFVGMRAPYCWVGPRLGSQDGRRSESVSGATAEAESVPAVGWTWSWALFGATCALPAALVSLQSPTDGLALALGSLPAAAVGVHGARRGRYVVLVVGVCIGLGLVLGAVLSRSWLLSVAGLFVLCMAAALLSARARVGSLLMTLPVPMVGAGLSFDGDIAAAAALATVMAAGAFYGWLLCLCWPEQQETARRHESLPGRAAMAEYGLRLGLAGALCTGIGFALDLEHKGWATAACLLVMRPTPEMTRLRGVGRAVSVTAGALVASILALRDVAAAVVAAVVVAALSCVAATRGSRWYVTGGFTTLIAILLLTYGTPNQATTRLFERVVETAVGVVIALIFGVAVPAARPRAERSD